MLEMTGNSLSGHLRLRCDVRKDGVPYLSQQSFRAPIHLSKSHISDDGTALVVTVVNPTAGFFDGDRLLSDVSVGAKARLVMSTPSSSRVFRMRGDSGKAAICEQKFSVERGGYLEWIPEAFIPHAGARYVQRTEIELEQGAGLLFIDWISPGRVAHGEVFQYEYLRWEFDLRMAGKLLARERYEMPGEGLEGITAMFEAGHYVSIYVAGEMQENWPSAEIDALNNSDVYIGHGALEGGQVRVVRALCRDSLAARRLIERLRRLFHENVNLKAPSLGRIFM